MAGTAFAIGSLLAHGAYASGVTRIVAFLMSGTTFGLVTFLFAHHRRRRSLGRGGLLS
jgi:hypothetical protein